jgi:hypothetical protein
MTRKRKAPSIGWPDTYEELVRQLMREHPGYTRAEMEQGIREAQARQEQKRGEVKPKAPSA